MSGKKSLLLNTLPLLFTCFAAVSGIYALGNYFEDAITRNQHLPILDLSAELLPFAYDNDLVTDYTSVDMPAWFGVRAATEVYRARLHGEPVGLIFSPVRSRGYNGMMELAIGIRYDGTLTGVRVLQHRETRGLGDQALRDDSPWLSGFNGRSLDNTPLGTWAVVKDGGRFDHVSGATASQRAVIRAVEHTLHYYRSNRERLFR